MTYAIEKCGKNLFCFKDDNVTVVSLHPGIVKTELFRDSQSNGGIKNFVTGIVVKRFGKTPYQGLFHIYKYLFSRIIINSSKYFKAL